MAYRETTIAILKEQGAYESLNRTVKYRLQAASNEFRCLWERSEFDGDDLKSTMLKVKSEVEDCHQLLAEMRKCRIRIEELNKTTS